jgi:hypothetical protein
MSKTIKWTNEIGGVQRFRVAMVQRKNDLSIYKKIISKQVGGEKHVNIVSSTFIKESLKCRKSV